MVRQAVNRAMAALWFAVVFAVTLAAQSPLGSILGTVSDQSGAVVPGVRVTIVNQDTGFKRSMTTNATGDYLFSDVDPGSYTLTVEATGFKKYAQSAFPLLTRQTLRLDVSLHVGSALETVEVKAQVSPVNSESVTIGEGYSPTQVKNYYQPLPMVRDTAELIGNYSLQSIGIGSAQYKVNGGRTDQVRVVQDGRVAYNDWGVPMTEAAELKLVTVNANAEFAMPGTVSVTSKSGTNSFHADMEYVISNNALNALGPNAATRAAGTGTYNSSFVGGGPVIIPKVYDGRNRTFFTVSYERSRSRDYQWYPRLNVPTMKMRTGDFSQYTDTSGNVIPIIDPLTGTQFDGNVIPSDRISAVSTNIQALYPEPNVGSSTSVLQNYTTTGHQFYSYNNFFMRFDQKITEKDTFNFSYKLNHQKARFDVGASGFAKIVGLYYAIQSQSVPGYAFAETHVFGPHMINEVRFAFDQYHQVSGEDVKGQTIMSQLGITGLDTSLDYTGVPNIKPSNFAGIGQVYNDSIFTENRFSYLDNLSIQVGTRHSIKVGFNYSRFPTTLTGATDNVFGTYTFTGRMTEGDLSSGGSSWADLLLGYPDTTTNITPRAKMRPFNYLFGAYVQDDWKVSPRLTVNLGVRYDLEGSPVDRSGLYYSFDPNNGALVFPDSYAQSKVSSLFNTSIPLELASAAGYPSNLIPVDKNNFAPRIGVAYRPFNNASTVFRAAYGIYTTGKLGTASNGVATTDLNLSGPFSLSQSFTNTQPGGGTVGTPTLSFPSPFLSSGTAASSYDVSFVNPNYHDPYMQQWNVSVEREFLQTAFRLSYVGDKSTNLTWTRNIDQVPASTIPYDISGCSEYGTRPSSTCRRNYYGFSSVSMLDNGGNGIYNSLQLEFTRHMAHGLQLHGGYVWSSDITDAEETTAYASPVGIDPYNRNYNRGLSSGIPRHRFQIDWTWEVPVGHGKHFLSTAPGVVDKVVGGWVFSGYAGFMNATPVSVTYTGRDSSGTGNTSGRADRIGNGNISNKTASRGFDSSAFTSPPCGAADLDYPDVTCMPIGRFGNSGRNIIYAPTSGYNYGRTTMMGLHKDIPLYQEKFRLRISAYATNPFNRWYYDTPDTVITSSTVGTMTKSGARTIQLGAKLQF